MRSDDRPKPIEDQARRHHFRPTVRPTPAGRRLRASRSATLGARPSASGALRGSTTWPPTGASSVSASPPARPSSWLPKPHVAPAHWSVGVIRTLDAEMASLNIAGDPFHPKGITRSNRASCRNRAIIVRSRLSVALSMSWPASRSVLPPKASIRPKVS